MTLLMAACGNNAAESGSSQSGNVSSLTNEEIIIGTVNEPTSMERNVGGSSGVSETTTRNVYEGLTSINDAGEVVNTLAENIDISEDGLTYTITLRPDVTFHDGTPLTSKDAAWVVSEAIAPESKSARASDLRVINKIETPDEQTLVLALDHKTASLPFFLASITVVKEGDKENTSKNGTGPYKLVEWVQGDHLTLEANPNYWGDAPKNPGVTFQFFTDETALDNALRTGAVDIVIQQESPDQLATFEDDPQYTVTSGDSIKKWVWTFNNAVAPFDDVRVRQALYKAIDRDALLTAVWGEYGTVIGSMPPVSEPWYDESFAGIHKYDPEAAKKLLKEAGVEGMSTDIKYVAGSAEEIIAQQLKSNLADIGVTLNLVPVDDPAWYEDVYTNKDYQTTLMDHNNPRDVLWYANPDFYWQYDNKEVQALKDKSDEAATLEEQVESIHALSEIIANEAPSAWLFMAPQIRISKSNVTGFSPDKNAEPFYVADIVKAG
jgi:ABC-type dipeptide transport system, periplasmic component